MALPDDLLRLAALGTMQRSGQANDASAIGGFAHHGAHQPETQLLLKVVTLKLRQQAGYQPFQGAVIDSLPPAPPDKTTPCNGRAVRHLLLMLQGKHKNLLAVWLNEMIETQQRLPDEVLPLLLDHSYPSNQLRQQLLKVIGVRGRWLAEVANNHRWRWVFDEDNRYEEWEEEALWREYLKRFRQRDPDAARETLIQYWDDLDIYKRLGLLDELRHGLSKNDEAFLLRLLDNEVLSVMAARMLCSIPDSIFGTSMRRAVEQMLVITRMGHRETWVIDFAWSTAFEARTPDTSRQYVTEIIENFKNRWTPEQMLSFVPLSYWYERWQITPAILVEGGRNGTKPSAILNAFSQAAAFANDNDFAYQALLQNKPNHMLQKGREQLISLLTVAQKEEIAIFWLDQIRHGFHEAHPARYIIEKIKQRWNERLMIAFLASLERRFTNTVRPMLKSPIRLVVEQVVAYFSLEMIDEVKRVLMLNKRPELTETELEVIDGVVAVLEFQQEIIRAIRNREA